MDSQEEISGEGKLILLVEDDKEASSVISEFLEMKGFEIKLAKDGMEGLEILDKIDPDLILLDIMMPGVNGFDVLLKIKSNPKTESIPVVMCTALTELKDVERCYHWGANGYITKPFDLKRVLTKINSILNPSSD